MDPAVRDFRTLIQYLVALHHAGNYYAMAKRLGVSSGLPYQWRDGTVKRPTIDTLRRLCEEYALDFADVLRLVHPPQAPRPRSTVRSLLMLVLVTLSTIGMIRPSLEPSTLGCWRAGDAMRLIGVWGARMILGLLKLPVGSRMAVA